MSIQGKSSLRFMLFMLTSITVWTSCLEGSAEGPASVTAEQIQTMIAEASPNETIIIPEGVYTGSLIINKSIALKANGRVSLVNDTLDAAIHITADHVSVQGIKIIDTTLKDTPTVLIEADQVKLEQLQIQTASHGVKLQGASHNEIRALTIVWDTAGSEEVKLSNRRNGIDLYDSHENRLIGNTISDMHDGIYIENSHRNVVDDNQVDRMRYGIHCMYTNGTEIRNNSGSLNITGAMVMAVKYVELTNNTFFKQSENVHSQGILLFDAHSSRFYDNTVEGNRVGFYIEQSSDNIFMRNQVEQNFIGIQFIEASANRFSDNRFSGNVIDAESRASSDNQIDGNFWDSFSGIDPDGDGRSDISNAINPFFQTIVKSRPAFQLFFQSPGMVFLESLFQGDREAWLADHTPLMNLPAHQISEGIDHSAKQAGGIGFILIAIALTTILFLGVRRT
jgi:nitrous oxidase accessory protein